MRILWIGKKPETGEAGDEIFDRKTIASLRARDHDVTIIHPERVAKWMEVVNLLRGVPHYRSRYSSARNRRMLQPPGSLYDLVICSWEPFDVFASCLARPLILITHNITSLALPSLFPESLFAKVAALRAGAWEKGLYRRSTFQAIATLSCRDRDYARGLADAPDIVLTIPGMPPLVGLAPDAMLQAELVLSGTYDWLPKRRDIALFARNYSLLPDRLPIMANGLPADMATALGARAAPGDAASRQAIRFGLVSDCFEAGHKLKTLAHIARNEIVLSFADVVSDVKDIPDHQFFIRRLETVQDIAVHVAEVAAHDPAQLRKRLLAFQQSCASRFTWQAVADRLVAAAATPDHA